MFVCLGGGDGGIKLDGGIMLDKHTQLATLGLSVTCTKYLHENQHSDALCLVSIGRNPVETGVHSHGFMVQA